MRPDRVGSYITFCPHKDDEEHTEKGKIVRRKDNGDLIVLCLTGRNRGNSKKVKPDQIVQSSAAPEVKEMIEAGVDKDLLISEVLNEDIFRHTYTVSMKEVQEIIDRLEKEISNFRAEENDGELWGYIEGESEALFRYGINSGEMRSDFSFQELKRLTPSDL